jgi:hypothetical protein
MMLFEKRRELRIEQEAVSIATLLGTNLLIAEPLALSKGETIPPYLIFSALMTLIPSKFFAIPSITD